MGGVGGGMLGGCVGMVWRGNGGVLGVIVGVCVVGVRDGMGGGMVVFGMLGRG